MHTTMPREFALDRRPRYVDRVGRRFALMAAARRCFLSSAVAAQ